MILLLSFKILLRVSNIFFSPYNQVKKKKKEKREGYFIIMNTLKPFDGEEKFFRFFLSIVVLGRSLGIFLGYFGTEIIKQRVYPRAPEQVTLLFGRMWSNWTIVSIFLVVMLILYPRNPQIYVTNVFAFSVALTHFLLEQFYFETGSMTNLITIFCFAGVTTIYMVLRYLIKKDIFSNENVQKSK